MIEGKPKRFLFFASWEYEAQGGMFDCKGSFDTLDEAKAYLNHPDMDHYDHAHIFDIETGKIEHINQ